MIDYIGKRQVGHENSPIIQDFSEKEAGHVFRATGLLSSFSADFWPTLGNCLGLLASDSESHLILLVLLCSLPHFLFSVSPFFPEPIGHNFISTWQLY